MEKRDFKGSVVLNPVPVVLISSKNNDGKENVFTVGWAGTVCTRPPMLSISIRPERLSYEYIKESMEFVVNIPHAGMTKQVDFCGVRSGRKVDKIEEMKFTMKKCTHINASYIEECPINIECRVKSVTALGSHDMFVAEVLGSHINEDLIDEKGKIHFEQGDLLAYCHGEYYKLPRTSIGSFGYSVMKKKVTKNNDKESKVEKKVYSDKIKNKNKVNVKIKSKKRQ